MSIYKANFKKEGKEHLPFEPSDSQGWTKHCRDEQWMVLASTKSPNLVILTSV